MMKRSFFTLFFALYTALGVCGQTSGPIDLILLLDTSASMSASYQEVNNYITGAFLREFLRTGDTFHLITFSDKPRLDISRRIEGRGDVETIIGRMFLQYPLDPFSDVQAALQFTEQYVYSLPARPKKIVLVSDGDITPPPGSASPAMDAAALRNLVSETKSRLGSWNTGLEYVQVQGGQALANMPSSGRPRPVKTAAPPQPGPAQPAPGVPPQPAAPAAAPQPGLAQSAPGTQPQPAAQPGPAQPAPGVPPQPATPAAAPQPGTAQSAPGTQPQPAAQPGPAQPAPGIPAAPPAQPEQQPMADAPLPPALATPATPDLPPPEPPAVSQETPVDTRPSARESPLAPRPVQPARTASEGGGSLPLFIGLGIAALLVLALIIFLISRQLQGSPNRAVARAAAPRPADDDLAPFVDHSKDLASYAASQSKPRTSPYVDRRPPDSSMLIDPKGPLLINLFVEDQNTFIGKRNIHALKSGYGFTVGGKKSDFLIFLVPIPQAIGEVRRDGSRCTFIPRKPKYFPDLGSRELPDCIGKTIRVVSDKNYELRFRLERYEDPLIALNRLFNSIKVPG